MLNNKFPEIITITKIGTKKLINAGYFSSYYLNTKKSKTNLIIAKPTTAYLIYLLLKVFKNML
jgi:hypothetical protein